MEFDLKEYKRLKEIYREKTLKELNLVKESKIKGKIISTESWRKAWEETSEAQKALVNYVNYSQSPNLSASPQGPDFIQGRFYKIPGRIVRRVVVGELNGFPVVEYRDVHTGEVIDITSGKVERSA